MTIKQLAYWLALNDQLEREVTEPPKDLKVAIAQLESRLRGVPNGESLSDSCGKLEGKQI